MHIYIIIFKNVLDDDVVFFCLFFFNEIIPLVVIVCDNDGIDTHNKTINNTLNKLQIVNDCKYTILKYVSSSLIFLKNFLTKL
jgi:hypothetical protein